MSMDSLDKSQTNLQHPTTNIIKSKYFKAIIGLFIMFSLIVTIGFIIRNEITLNNKLWNQQSKMYIQQRLNKYSK
jgi:predicted lipid-binding transport protein (Tim44 family)